MGLAQKDFGSVRCHLKNSRVNLYQLCAAESDIYQARLNIFHFDAPFYYVCMCDVELHHAGILARVAVISC